MFTLLHLKYEWIMAERLSTTNSVNKPPEILSLLYIHDTKHNLLGKTVSNQMKLISILG